MLTEPEVMMQRRATEISGVEKLRIIVFSQADGFRLAPKPYRFDVSGDM